MKNLTSQEFSVSRTHRESLNGHKSFMIWFSGLSGSGKSTLANMLEAELHQKKVNTFLLDGDNVRLGLNKDLTFTEEDRCENLRRVGEIGKLMIDAGVVTLAAFVSPFEKDRQMVKNILGKENFVEIYVSTPLEECIRRDVKGLYKKAINGQIKEFTGISSPYEPPLEADLDIDTSQKMPENCIQEILTFILPRL